MLLGIFMISPTQFHGVIRSGEFSLGFISLISFFKKINDSHKLFASTNSFILGGSKQLLWKRIARNLNNPHSRNGALLTKLCFWTQRLKHLLKPQKDKCGRACSRALYPESHIISQQLANGPVKGRQKMQVSSLKQQIRRLNKVLQPWGHGTLSKWLS